MFHTYYTFLAMNNYNKPQYITSLFLNTKYPYIRENETKILNTGNMYIKSNTNVFYGVSFKPLKVFAAIRCIFLTHTDVAEALVPCEM